MHTTCNLPDMQFTRMNMQYPAKKLTPYPGDAYVTLTCGTAWRGGIPVLRGRQGEAGEPARNDPYAVPRREGRL